MIDYKLNYIKEIKTQIKVHRLLLITYSNYCIFCEEIAGYEDIASNTLECGCILHLKAELKKLGQ
jgi:hypothetical protein